MPTPAADLIASLCGRGWDAPVQVDLVRARALLDAGPTTIFAAAAAGDTAALRRFVEADPDSVSRPGGPRDWAPLLYAAASHAHQLGRSEAVTEGLKLLLQAGADPDTHYSADGADNGFSALYLTIAVSGHRSRTDALLAAGASPSDGNSSYHAVETFDLDLLQALGTAGLAPDDVSYTIKHAIDMGWEDAVLYLLSLGADPNATHPLAGETTLHWAIKRNASDAVLDALLAAGADPSVCTEATPEADFGPNRWTPLDLAVRLGHRSAVAKMVAAGMVLPEVDGVDAFIVAVARGDEGAARLAMAGGVSIPADLTGLHRKWPAFWAQHGRRAAVELACTLGLPLDGTAWMGLTALHWAALRGDASMVDGLLSAGAPQTDLGGYFQTPHHTAATCQWYASGDYDAVMALLSAG